MKDKDFEVRLQDVVSNFDYSPAKGWSDRLRASIRKHLKPLYKRQLDRIDHLERECLIEATGRDALDMS